MNSVRSYFDFCTYWVVANPAGVHPPDGGKYFKDLTACPYCSNPLTKETVQDHWTRRQKEMDADPINSPYDFRVTIAVCTNQLCGWWALEDYEYFAEILKEVVGILWGQVKNFDISSREVPIGLLRNELHTNPNLVYLTHHDTFERLMADCLKDKFPGSFVKHVGRSGDGGVDIYAVLDDDLCLVQTKRRRNGSIAEGPTAVRELNGVLLREGAYHGMLISTAERFSKAAYAETVIKMETKKPVRIDLIAYEGIIEMVRKRVTVYEPWRDLLIPRTDRTGKGEHG